jgi:hypothetical protein
MLSGDRGSTVVKVLRYKSEGRWFDPRWYQFFIDINPSDRTMALGSTRPLTEMSKAGKAVPLLAWSGSECSRKIRFTDLLTTAQDWGKFVSLMQLPGNNTGTNFC